jgi:hypothetical protein
MTTVSKTEGQDLMQLQWSIRNKASKTRSLLYKRSNKLLETSIKQLLLLYNNLNCTKTKEEIHVS